MKTKSISYILFITVLLLSGCNEVLDKENLTAVNPSDVWHNEALARAYIDNINSSLMPGVPSSADVATDDIIPAQRQTVSWMTGTATFDSWNTFGTYGSIRAINIFLGGIDGATFDVTPKNQLKGQALFWRAWCYHGMVKGYGGVPLILETQYPTPDLTDLALPRNKTSECVTQIIKDLDDAIALLPDSWSGSDLGRIDKGAAMAFKGRVLLFYASPLFNGLGGVASWQKAYDANKVAVEFLKGRGNGLYSPYSKIWDDELNKEQIMFRRYNYPEVTASLAGSISLTWSRDAAGNDHPSLELVNAFPMKDGSAWDPATMSYDTLFKHRDDRFYSCIYFNGSPNQYLQGMRDDKTYLWTYWDEITDYYSPTGVTGQHNQITLDVLGSNSSFYRIKNIDKYITRTTVHQNAVDYPEIRYAEVLMNFGECANELDKTSEALDVLYQIRERAGVEAGANGKYGITAASTASIRDLYKKERMVEFCFENKRLDDIRRWKMFDYLRSLGQRHGVAHELKPGEKDVEPMDDINVVWKRFKTTVVKCDLQDIAIKDQYYFYGIPKSIMDRNAKLLQNNNWGGTFDPLQ